MKVSRVFGAALALSLPLWGFAQTPVTNPTVLELRLQPESVQKHIPQAFTVLIVNKSDHEVRLPMPSLACGDVPHGTVRLHVKFKPFKGGGSALDSGCIKDFGYQTILDRLKQWKVLGPGESLVLMSNGILAHDSGVYEYWASYIPPGMPKADEEVLQNVRVDFPKSELESTHVSFVRAR